MRIYVGLVPCVCLLSGGCMRVHQIDRGRLSKRMMQFEPLPEEQRFVSEFRTIREGAAGGAGHSAGFGLVAAPCSAPVLAALLVYTASQQDVLGGGLMLLSFASGFSVLLIVLGLSANALRYLPRSDRWMVWVKRFLAGCLLGGGRYFVFRAGQLY